MRLSRARALVIVALAGIGTPVQADDDSLRWGIAGEVLQFNYREFDVDDRELNHEFGPVPGLRLTVRGTRERLFARFDATAHYGEVTYDGETQSGRPIESTTETGLASVSAEPGYWLDSARRWGAFARFARRQWDRDIQPVGRVQGLYERYRWSEVGLGLRHVWSRPSTNQWGHEVSVSGFAVVDGDIYVDLSGLAGSDLDDVTLQLGDSAGGRLRYTASLGLNADCNLRIEPWLAFWEFGRSNTRAVTSNGVPVGQFVVEPRSESWRAGLTLGLDF